MSEILIIDRVPADKGTACWACFRDRGEVDVFVAFPDGYVCGECLELAHNMVVKNHKPEIEINMTNMTMKKATQ